MTASNGMWREQCPSLISRLSWMMKAGHLTDIQFLVGNGCPKQYTAHRLILASGSPEFERMFFQQYPEVEQPIKLPDIDPIGFRFMLRYLYEDHTTFSTEKEIFSTFHVADKFKITNLKELCCFQIFKIKPSLENIWSVLEFSHHFPLGDLPRLGVEFLIANAREVFQTDYFLTASEHLLKFMLQLPLIRVTEMEVLKFVTHWAENSAKCNLQHIQQVIRPLLPHIHFPSIPLEDFSCFVRDKKGLFDSDDQLAIQFHLDNPRANRLPSWCCTNGPRCGLLERLSIQLVDNKRKTPFTSAVSSFEMRYEITLSNPVYQDIMNMTFLWYNRQEDLPLVCDVVIESDKSVFSKKGIEKRFPYEGVSVEFDRTFLNSPRQVFSVYVNLKHTARIAFLEPVAMSQLPIQFRLIGASGTTQQKKKVVFSKAQAISDITMIRRTALRSSSVESNSKKLSPNSGGTKKSIGSGQTKRTILSKTRPATYVTKPQGTALKNSDVQSNSKKLPPNSGGTKKLVDVSQTKPTVLSKVRTTSDVTMIKKIALQNTSGKFGSKKLVTNTGGSRKLVGATQTSPPVSKILVEQQRQTKPKTIRSLQNS